MSLSDEIKEFIGKRNSVLTFLFPPNYPYQTDLVKVVRKVKNIKHANKRHQCIQVLLKVEKQLNNIKKFKHNGAIILAGMDNYNVVQYWNLDVPNKIDNFEYYFDDRFHLERVKEIFYKSINKVTDLSILDKLENQILLANYDIAFLNDYKQELENGNIDSVYFLNTEIFESVIEIAKQYKSKIYKINSNEYKVGEFIYKYGNVIATLRIKN